MDMPVGLAVASIRKGMRLSQSDLAQRMDCPRTQISKIENQRHGVSVEMLCRISEAFGIEAWKVLRHATRLQQEIDEATSTPATQETAHGR